MNTEITGVKRPWLMAMTTASTAKTRASALLLATVAGLSLAACEPGSGPLASAPQTEGDAEASPAEAPAAKTQRSTRLVERTHRGF